VTTSFPEDIFYAKLPEVNFILVFVGRVCRGWPRVYATGEGVCCANSLFVLMCPTVPWISPNPIAPARGVAPKGQPPRAVAANVCVKTILVAEVTPFTVKREGAFVTTGYCDAAIELTTPAPPPAATCAVAREVKEQRMRTADVGIDSCILREC
jgi:hypothetical protein